jgi:hypothetical protein
MFRIILLFFVISFVLLPMVSGMTVLLLKDGGTVEGELLNPNEISRKLYRMKTTGGIEISLDAKLVEREQNRERAAIIEYNTKAPLTEHTVENHLYWARWCNEQQLLNQAKLHWQQILELDPDHTDARRVLGYIKNPTDPTGWILQRDRLESRGLTQDRGRWKTQYQIEVEKILENRDNETLYWQRTVRNLRQRLPNAQAESELLDIRDPAAFIALRDALLAEGNPHNQVVLLRSLVRIPSNRALQFVVGWSIRPDGTSEDVRKICIEELQKQINENPDIRQIMIETYRSILHSKTHPALIHLAARALGDVEGYEAVPELIDVLVVTVTKSYQEQPQDYVFGPGGTSLNHGTRTIKGTEPVPNQTVLTTLRKLTGVNFGFDQTAWREWYWQPKRSPSFNLRRN